MNKITLFWLASTIILFIVEAVTVNLVTIWFAFGTLAALIAGLCGAELWLQIVIFLAVTICTLIPLRKISKKFFNKTSHQPTNADMVIGADCMVIEKIDNLNATGAVKHQGKVWTARSQNGEVIECGTIVTALVIEGVKLIVIKKEENILSI